MNYQTDNLNFHKEVFNLVGDVVQECYNYLNDDEAEYLEVIYAIGSMEEGWFSFRLFFQIQNKLFEIHQIKNRDDHDSQIAIQQYGTDFLQKLEKVFDSYEQQIPTEIKIQYFVKEEDVKYNFEYELQWSNKEDGVSSDTYDEWFSKINNSLKN